MIALSEGGESIHQQDHPVKTAKRPTHLQQVLTKAETGRKCESRLRYQNCGNQIFISRVYPGSPTAQQQASVFNKLYTPGYAHAVASC